MKLSKIVGLLPEKKKDVPVLLAKDDPEKQKIYQKRYRERHLEERRRSQREWSKSFRKENLEIARKNDKKFHIKYRNKRCAYLKERYNNTSKDKEFYDKRKEISLRYYYKNQIKAKARIALNKAILKDKIIKPNFCSGCLKECSPQGHHEDYNKPLEVIWLCKECHRVIENINYIKKQ